MPRRTTSYRFSGAIGLALGFALLFAVQGAGWIRTPNPTGGPGPYWEDRTVILNIRMTCTNGGIDFTCWKDAALAAARAWNDVSNFTFQAYGSPLSNSPCNLFDGVRTVDGFYTRACDGSDFGDAIAVTYQRYYPDGTFADADIILNNNVGWNMYYGPEQYLENGEKRHDLYRTLIHEFGHMLGLDHPNDFGQNVTAIMNGWHGDLDSLQADDIAGVNAIYPSATGGNEGDTDGATDTGTASDDHGSTTGTATVIAASSATSGVLEAAGDSDVFRVILTQAGTLTALTSGTTDTFGTLRDSSHTLATDDDGGADRNFSIAASLNAGTYYIVVTGWNDTSTGNYTLTLTFTPDLSVVGNLENPGVGSYRSGIGVISGWVCSASSVLVTVDGTPIQTAYGTNRPDTVSVCGDTNNGFGVLYNWNRFGGGTHTAIAYADGVEFGRADFTVATYGVEFLTGIAQIHPSAGRYSITDFPVTGTNQIVRWDQSVQNFVIESQEWGHNSEAAQGASSSLGNLENPGAAAYKSGIGIISGWVCSANEVVVIIDGVVEIETAYGTERTDTTGVCGDSNNGFGALYNWNRLGDGGHQAIAYADGVQFAWANFIVTTLGVEFLTGVAETHKWGGKIGLAGFPEAGTDTKIGWDQSVQNFVIEGWRWP